MTFGGTPRPRLRWHHAETELDDFAIVTFRAPSPAVAAHLPDGFAPRGLTFDDGTTGTLVSAVAFRDRDFHFRFCPPATVSCGQINYRAYVTAHGRPGVWFFETTLDHAVVHIPRLLWGMPWRRDPIAISADWTAGTWRLSGPASCEADASGDLSDQVDGFGSRDGWLSFLTHPTSGWYRKPNGGLGEYSIWHPPMEPRALAARTARFPVLEKLGLIEPGAAPHSVLAQPRLHFDIHTPPGRYRGGR